MYHCPSSVIVHPEIAKVPSIPNPPHLQPAMLVAAQSASAFSAVRGEAQAESGKLNLGTRPRPAWGIKSEVVVDFC